MSVHSVWRTANVRFTPKKSVACLGMSLAFLLLGQCVWASQPLPQYALGSLALPVESHVLPLSDEGTPQGLAALPHTPVLMPSASFERSRPVKGQTSSQNPTKMVTDGDRLRIVAWPPRP